MEQSLQLQKSFDMGYIPKESTILTLRGRRETLEQPLVSPYGKPRGGWYVNVLIKGIPTRVSENSPNRVFTAVKDTLKTNSLNPSDTNIWFNLNIQWYSRLAEKHMWVRHNDLLLLADTSSQPRTINPSARNYSPADWGMHAWNFMGAFLAQDTYSWSGFLILLESVQRMLNNAENPTIGCNDCYLEFTKELNFIKQNPIYDPAIARIWLVNFHNSVNVRINKPMLSHDAAEKLYLWK